MNRFILIAPIVLAACADVPADWGFTDNDPRRAFVPAEYADDPVPRSVYSHTIYCRPPACN